MLDFLDLRDFRDLRDLRDLRDFLDLRDLRDLRILRVFPPLINDSGKFDGSKFLFSTAFPNKLSISASLNSGESPLRTSSLFFSIKF